MDIEHLYRDHHRWLVNWIYRRVSEGRDAEDLAQTTFMRILDKREPEVIQAPRPYLTTIARSLVSNFYRRQDLEHAYLEALANQPPVEAPSPEQIEEHLQLLCLISALLDDLPEKPRQAFLLARLEGLKYAEIAENLGVSVSQVKKYLFKATQHCMKLMV